jgi:CxC6 like cysteine cluster associated with KDZ transposases
MGCPSCNVHDCDNPLASVRDKFCPVHEHLNRVCAIVSCSEAVETGFTTCADPEHRSLELHYYERGKAMFQLKSRLRRLRITQTHDSLSMGSSSTDPDRLMARDGHAVAAANLQPDPAETIKDDDETNFEGPGDSDDQVLLDFTGDLCDGKPETGNRKLRAQFGRRRSHNEELCVTSCGVTLGRERFYGSEAPNGVRVRHFDQYNV